MDLCDKTAHELCELLGARDTTCAELAESVLGRVDDVEGTLSSFITLERGCVSSAVEGMDAGRLKPGTRGPLWGIPIGIKDNICTRDLPTTCASRILEGYVPPYDATAVSRLADAGAVLLGKCNMDEFGMGSSTEYSAFGPTRNPWDPSRVPGGSSGGSVAAVAAGEAIVALGSDTGGSVRLPASFCGVVGMRPSYGTVSRFGLVAFGSSMDQIGVIARDVRDCRTTLEVIAGPDGRDATVNPGSGAKRRPQGDAERRSSPVSLTGRSIGVPFGALESGLHAEVRGSFERALNVLQSLGAEVRSVDLIDPAYAVAAYYVIANCEASSNMARYDGVGYGKRIAAESVDEMMVRTRSRLLGPEVQRRIMLGTYALSSGYYDQYYLRASRVRHLVCRDLYSTLEGVDWVAVPTAATPPFKIGEKMEDPLEMYLTDVFTTAPALAGLPCISLPMGLSSERLPLGLQMIGAPGADWKLLDGAEAFQEAAGFHGLRPPPVGGGSQAGRR